MYAERVVFSQNTVYLLDNVPWNYYLSFCIYEFKVLLNESDSVNV